MSENLENLFSNESDKNKANEFLDAIKKFLKTLDQQKTKQELEDKNINSIPIIDLDELKGKEVLEKTRDLIWWEGKMEIDYGTIKFEDFLNSDVGRQIKKQLMSQHHWETSKINALIGAVIHSAYFALLSNRSVDQGPDEVSKHNKENFNSNKSDINLLIWNQLKDDFDLDIAQEAKPLIELYTRFVAEALKRGKENGDFDDFVNRNQQDEDV
ncbi:MAG: hypothetical protein ACP5IC_01165 [Minisyncoccia bacterium]